MALLSFKHVYSALIIAIVLMVDTAHGGSRQQILQSLLSTSGYDASVPPDFEMDHATNVSIQLAIENMYSVRETDMEFSIDCILRQVWVDKRLAFDQSNTSALKLELDLKQIASVWQPDLYFKNEKRASIHTITNSNKLMHIHRNGTIVYSMRIALTLTCTMMLHLFPFDSQTCSIMVQSFGYTDENIDIRWRKSDAVRLPNIEMPQFELLPEVELTEESERFETGKFTILKATIRIDRKTGYYVLQVIVPSVLLVVLSWFSFWIDPNVVPARISLGVTCILTMTTQSSGIRQTLPPVSYVKAIDIWMIVCLMFVFGALLEYAFVTVQIRPKDKSKPEDTTEDTTEDNCEIVGNDDGMILTKYPNPDVQGNRNTDTESNEKPSRFLALKNCFPHKNRSKGPTIDHVSLAKKVDLISRIAFPAVFILFVFVFFCVCLLARDPTPSDDI